jgi:hypothetical protein
MWFITLLLSLLQPLLGGGSWSEVVSTFVGQLLHLLGLGS